MNATKWFVILNGPKGDYFPLIALSAMAELRLFDTEDAANEAAAATMFGDHCGWEIFPI